MSQKDRQYQVIVWGATGLTGQLVCEWISKKYAGNISWAIAGRNYQKLQNVQEKFGKKFKLNNKISIEQADLNNPKSLDNMTSKAEVVISTVGPYSLYGTPLIESAIRSQTHVCDLTAEVPWVMSMIDKYHELAKSKGVKIVNFCGFEVVPFDIGSFMLSEYAQNNYGKTCKQIQPVMQISPFSGISLGTLESVVYSYKNFPNLIEDVKSVYCLAKEDKSGEELPEDYWYRYDKKITKSWLAGSILQVNTARTFRRSNILLKHKYGEDVKYNEYIDCLLFPLALFSAIFINLIFLLFRLELFRFLIHTLYQIFSKYFGLGPSQFIMRNIFWGVKIYGIVDEKVSGQEKILQLQIKGNNDAAYMDSAQLLLEVALTLVLEKQEIKDQKDLPKGGILTPAAACGKALYSRLKKAEFQISDITELK